MLEQDPCPLAIFIQSFEMAYPSSAQSAAAAAGSEKRYNRNFPSLFVCFPTSLFYNEIFFQQLPSIRNHLKKRLYDQMPRSCLIVPDPFISRVERKLEYLESTPLMQWIMEMTCSVPLRMWTLTSYHRY